MEQATQLVVESDPGKFPSEIEATKPHEQATPSLAETILGQDDGDEIDASVDVVYGDTLGELLPSELRYLLMSWRAAA